MCIYAGDSVADSSLTSSSSYRDVGAMTSSSEFIHMTPANVTASTVSFTLPYDRPATAAHNVSRVSPSLSHLSSRSSTPSTDLPPPQPPEQLPEKPPMLSAKPPKLLDRPLVQSEKPPTVSEKLPILPERPPNLPEKSPLQSGKPTALSGKPPPPYPGTDAAAVLRPGRPTSPLNDRTTATDAESVDIDSSRQAAAAAAGEDSSDEDGDTVTECQRIESPKPVRRAGDDSRSCETKVIISCSQISYSKNEKKLKLIS